MDHIILLTALFPVAVLIFYICYKDRKQPEPKSQLVKAFFFGVLSVPLSLCMSIPAGWLGLYTDEPTTILGAINSAFVSAAIPEEIAKFIMLWLLLRKNRYFDEKLDGIVYAVFVALGFAALENTIYLFSNYDDFLSVGITRAIFAVPGHFCDGVLMGYYYSLVKFYPQTSKKNLILVLLAPIIIHGTYDAILFVVDVTPALTGIMLIIFLLFCWRMWKYCRNRIEEHRLRDYCYDVETEMQQED